MEVCVHSHVPTALLREVESVPAILAAVPVWRDAHPGFRSPGRPSCSESLYRSRCRGPRCVSNRNTEATFKLNREVIWYLISTRSFHFKLCYKKAMNSRNSEKCAVDPVRQYQVLKEDSVECSLCMFSYICKLKFIQCHVQPPTLLRGGAKGLSWDTIAFY
jgi:hypothetical protein